MNTMEGVGQINQRFPVEDRLLVETAVTEDTTDEADDVAFKQEEIVT